MQVKWGKEIGSECRYIFYFYFLHEKRKISTTCFLGDQLQVNYIHSFSEKKKRSLPMTLKSISLKDKSNGCPSTNLFQWNITLLKCG